MKFDGISLMPVICGRHGHIIEGGGSGGNEVEVGGGGDGNNTRTYVHTHIPIGKEGHLINGKHHQKAMHNNTHHHYSNDNNDNDNDSNNSNNNNKHQNNSSIINRKLASTHVHHSMDRFRDRLFLWHKNTESTPHDCRIQSAAHLMDIKIITTEMNGKVE